jgi:outer membrane autotransporter protein
MNVTVGGYIPNNTVLSNVVNGTGVSVPGTITSSSPVFAFTGSVAANKVSLTATRANSYNSFASNSNAANAGAVLNTIAMNNTATGDMANVLNSLDSLSSASAINQALESMTPDTDNSSTQTSQASMDQFLSSIFAHLDGFKDVMASSPDSAASDVIVLKDPDVWTSGFGTYLHQDEAGSSGGYNATIWGTILGFEIELIKNLRVGL